MLTPAEIGVPLQGTLTKNRDRLLGGDFATSDLLMHSAPASDIALKLPVPDDLGCIPGLSASARVSFGA